MHLHTISKPTPGQAGIRESLELLLLFMDVVSAGIGIIRKAPFEGGQDHDHDHNGHTH